MNSRKLFIAGLLSIAVGIFTNGCTSTGGTAADANHPMLGVLDQFDHAPAKGSQEADMPVRALPTNSVTTDWPGNGLAQHPFLYYGEGNNALYVVNHGRVV